MEKIPLSRFAVALLSVLVCSSSAYAQGIYQGSRRVDNIADFAMDAESTEPLTFGAITVELPAEDDYSLRVSDISGRIVTEQQGYGHTINVDLAGQSKGSYPFQLQTTMGSMSNVIILK